MTVRIQELAALYRKPTGGLLRFPTREISLMLMLHSQTEKRTNNGAANEEELQRRVKSFTLSQLAHQRKEHRAAWKLPFRDSLS